jgi:hypothetical protein
LVLSNGPLLDERERRHRKANAEVSQRAAALLAVEWAERMEKLGGTLIS